MCLPKLEDQLIQLSFWMQITEPGSSYPIIKWCLSEDHAFMITSILWPRILCTVMHAGKSHPTSDPICGEEKEQSSNPASDSALQGYDPGQREEG